MAQTCDRCGGETVCAQMSLFDTSMCCSTCIEKERAHPKFPEARARELEELQVGNTTFPGIGLPPDLKI
jgi:hypothetical protein